MKLFISLFFLSLIASAKVTSSQFEGEYLKRHDVVVVSENNSVRNVEDRVKIQATSPTETQVVMETFSGNLHSCQLIGKAQLEGDALIFKTPISPKLNRGKKGTCVLKITKPTAEKSVQIEDVEGLCRLKFCGQQAELGGLFQVKPPVDVQDKN